MFQEGLNQFRDLLEKGADVLVTLQAADEGEDVRARIVNVERLTDAAAKVQKGLRVFVRDEAPLESIERRLTAPGEGEVSLVVILRAAGRRSRNPPTRPLFGERRHRRSAQGCARRGSGGAGLSSMRPAAARLRRPRAATGRRGHWSEALAQQASLRY